MPVSIPGIENLSPAVKYVIAFAIIFVLLALFALILRRLTGGKMALSNDRGRARQPRLGIVDVYDLDRQRQLILLRRDNVEHLLLVGGPNDVVVETNIIRVPGARLPLPPEADRTEPAVERPVEIPATRPSLDAASLRGGDRIAEPTVSAHLGAEPIAASATPAPAGPRPTPPGLAAQTPRAPDVRGAARERPAAAPGSNDASRALEAAVGRAVQPAEPPKPAPPPPPPAAPPSPPPRSRAPEPAPARPSPPPAPPPPRAEPAAPKPAPAPPPPRPMPAESAERPAPPQPAPAPPASAPPRSAPAAPVPPPSPAKAETAPPFSAKAETAPPAAAAAAKPDPFSIEDIEAEFARLLGRPLDRKE